MRTSAAAIARSVSHDEIVHLDHDAAVAADLLVACEDSTTSDTEAEYWGTTEDGHEWRVHMARSEGE